MFGMLLMTTIMEGSQYLRITRMSLPRSAGTRAGPTPPGLRLGPARRECSRGAGAGEPPAGAGPVIPLDERVDDPDVDADASLEHAPRRHRERAAHVWVRR